MVSGVGGDRLMAGQSGRAGRKRVVKEVQFEHTQRSDESTREERDRKDAAYDLEILRGDPREEVEQLYGLLKILRAPSEGPGRPAITVVNMGFMRIANALYDQGVRYHPELASCRWISSPGITPGHDQDEGKWIQRNPDGSWPDDDPMKNLDPAKDIEVQPVTDGTFMAIHKASQRHVEGFRTRAEAVAGMIAELAQAQQEMESERNVQ